MTTSLGVGPGDEDPKAAQPQEALRAVVRPDGTAQGLRLGDIGRDQRDSRKEPLAHLIAQGGVGNGLPGPRGQDGVQDHRQVRVFAQHGGQDPHHGSAAEEPDLDGRHAGILQDQATLLFYLARGLGPEVPQPTSVLGGEARDDPQRVGTGRADGLAVGANPGPSAGVVSGDAQYRRDSLVWMHW